MIDEIEKSIISSSDVIRNSVSLSSNISEAIKIMIKCIKSKNKIILFGNGGSAADAQHIASELIGRYKQERDSYPAIALTTDSSIITSIANDYSYEMVFSRQCESIVKENDVVIGISTSGNSKNVENALKVSKTNGATTIGLLGNNGGKIKEFVDVPIIVNSTNTATIQEVHRVIYHIICDFIENDMKEA